MVEAPGSATSGVTLRYYLNILRRRRWTMVIVVLTVLGAAAALTFAQQEEYEAQAKALLSRQNLANSLTDTVAADQFGDATRSAATQAELALTPEVARRTL